MFSLLKPKSVSRRPWAAALLLLALASTQAAPVCAAPQGGVADTIQAIVGGREFVTGYVMTIKSKYQPDAPEYAEAMKRYQLAMSKYNGWAASVKMAIRQGKAKDIKKDASYRTAAAEADAAAKSFIDYAESKMGQPKGAFAAIGALADFGIKVWDAYRNRKAQERAAEAEAFYEDVKWDQWSLIAAGGDAKGQEETAGETKGPQGPIEEVHQGDPPIGDTKGAGETLSLDAAAAAEIETQVSAGGAKGPIVDSRELALATLELAKEYARVGTSRREPPSPTKVKAFLALYGLGFRYPDGQFIPYCAAGVGFAAAQAHYRLAQRRDPGTDLRILRGELADLTRDYTKTHPATRVMMSAARARGNWVSHTERPQPGWLVFYNWSGSKAFPQHVGIVESVGSDGRILRTVEFNTSDDNPSNGGRVERKTRSVRYVMGYIRTYPSGGQQARAENR